MKAIIVAVAVLGVAISSSVWQGASTESNKSITSAPLSKQSDEMVSIAVGNSDGTTLVSARDNDKRKPREASCENPVVTTTESIPVELKNQALVEGMEAFDQFQEDHSVVATPEEREAYVKQLAEVLATEVVTENIYIDAAETPGVITDNEANPTDSEAEKVKNRAKRGCRGKDHAGSAQLVSFSTVAYDNSVGWKSCSKTVSFKALNGLTIGKLRLVSEWYNNAFQVPQWIEARATGTAYYLWKTDGDEDLRIARPYYKYDSGVWYAYQNRAWQDFKYEISASVGGIGGSIVLDTHTLYAAHIVGPGGKCV
jgi:hypothetical protein